MSKWTLLIAFVAAGGTLRAAALKPDGVARFFVVPQTASVLRWRVDGAGAAGGYDYTVRDYWGRTVATGRVKAGGKGGVEATVKLPLGFYDVELPATKRRFGVVSLPPAPKPADPFFCIDSALSWLVRDDDVRDGLVAALARSGIAMSRERLSWSRINPAKGKWAWQADRRYDTVRTLHRTHGVAVLEMFHDAPSWPGKVGKYPADLAAAGRSWQRIARRWHATWGALEVWNEPDIFFGANLPADQYVPLAKAVAYALQREELDVPLVGGVMAHCNRVYLDTSADNGLLDCVDAFSFHTYGRAMQMEALIGRYRRWLGDHGRPAKPLWLTECGRPWKRGPARPPADQDVASALDITMKAIEARCGGVARYFAFVYPFYEERNNNFGMMGRWGTPLRSFAAYAHLAGVLRGKRYVGDLACGDPRVKRARVFADRREKIAVLYTGAPGEQGAVQPGVAVRRAAGIDGRALTLGKDGAVPIRDGLTYVWLDAAKLGKRLRTDTAAMKLWKLGRSKPRPHAAPAAIILRFEADRRVLRLDSEGYVFAREDGAKGFRFRVRAFNLADRAAALKVTLAPPRGGRLTEGSAVQSAEVPPGGHVDVTWRLDLRGAYERTNRVRLTVTAAAGEARGLPLAVVLRGGASLRQVLKGRTRRLRLPIDQPARWTQNVPRYGRMSMSWPGEQGLTFWRLRVSWGPGDPWVYPVFRLPKEVDLSGYASLVVRARCHKPAAVRVFLWEGGGGVGYLTPSSIVPPDGEWHTAVIRFSDLVRSTANAEDPNGRLDLKAVRRISIGLNSEGRENTLDVSDAYVVR